MGSPQQSGDRSTPITCSDKHKDGTLTTYLICIYYIYIYILYRIILYYICKMYTCAQKNIVDIPKSWYRRELGRWDDPYITNMSGNVGKC